MNKPIVLILAYGLLISLVIVACTANNHLSIKALLTSSSSGASDESMFTNVDKRDRRNLYNTYLTYCIRSICFFILF